MEEDPEEEPEVEGEPRGWPEVVPRGRMEGGTWEALEEQEDPEEYVDEEELEENPDKGLEGAQRRGRGRRRRPEWEEVWNVPDNDSKWKDLEVYPKEFPEEDQEEDIKEDSEDPGGGSRRGPKKRT
jgi:hypothetical protein